MAQAPSKDELYQLIVGMESSERRLFKMFMAQSAGKKADNYMILFDTLASMKEFDSEKLLQNLHHKIPASSLSSTKSRLFNLILKSYRAQNESKGTEASLKATIIDIELLIDRKLEKASRKRIQQAKGLASQYELDELLLQVLNLEAGHYQQFGRKGQKDFFEQNLIATRECLDRLKTVQVLRSLYTRLRYILQSNTQIRKEESNLQATLGEILSTPEVLADPPEFPLIANSYHQNIWGVHHVQEGNFNQAHTIYSQLVRRWLAKPHLIPAYPSLYLGIVNNYLTAALFASQMKSEFLQILGQIKTSVQLSEQDRIKLERITYYHEMNFHLNYGTYESGMIFIGKLVRWLGKFQSHLKANRLLVFHYSIASFFFVYGEFSRANRHILTLVNFPPGNERIEIRNFSRILQLMVQHELGNHELKDYLLRSTYRYFQRGQKLYAYERALIHYFKQKEKVLTTDLAPENELNEWLQKTSEQEGKYPLGVPLISIWLQSKLRSMPIREYFEDVVRKQSEEATSAAPPQS